MTFYWRLLLALALLGCQINVGSAKQPPSSTTLPEEKFFYICSANKIGECDEYLKLQVSYIIDGPQNWRDEYFIQTCSQKQEETPETITYSFIGYNQIRIDRPPPGEVWGQTIIHTTKNYRTPLWIRALLVEADNTSVKSEWLYED